jgi:hypothetical protein
VGIGGAVRCRDERARTAAAVALAAAAGYLAGGYLGLPAPLKSDEYAHDDVERSVAKAFDAFAAGCDLSLPTEGECTVTRSDGSSEIYSVTVNRDGCWFAQRTDSSGGVGALPAGKPIRRGCAD